MLTTLINLVEEIARITEDIDQKNKLHKPLTTDLFDKKASTIDKQKNITTIPNSQTC